MSGLTAFGNVVMVYCIALATCIAVIVIAGLFDSRR